MKRLAIKLKERAPKPQQKASLVYNALLDGLAEMRKQGVDRVILGVYESPKSDNCPLTGRFINANEMAYYPFDTLTPSEQEMILSGRDYRVTALVTKNVGDLVTYPGDGVESYRRRKMFPFLPELNHDSGLNYLTAGGVYTGESLEEFARKVEGCGWTPELIAKRIKAGIQEYNDVTVRLMESAGVHESIKRISERKESL